MVNVIRKLIDSWGGSPQPEKKALESATREAIQALQLRKLPEPRLSEIGLTEPVCPHCSGQLENIHDPECECPHCHESIFIGKRPFDGVKVILTEEQADQIESERRELKLRKDPYLEEKGEQAVNTEYTKLWIQLGREPSIHDIVWSLLRQDLLQHATHQNWRLYRETKRKMAEVLAGEKRLNEALKLDLEVCYHDLNGARDTVSMQQPGESSKEHPPFDLSDSQLQPGVVSDVESIITELGMSLSEVEAIFIERASKEHSALRMPMVPDEAWEKLKGELIRHG